MVDQTVETREGRKKKETFQEKAWLNSWSLFQSYNIMQNRQQINSDSKGIITATTIGHQTHGTKPTAFQTIARSTSIATTEGGDRESTKEDVFFCMIGPLEFVTPEGQDDNEEIYNGDYVYS